MTNDNSESVFARYIDAPKERPTESEKILRGPLLKPIAPEATRQSSSTEKLLDFLVNHWSKPTIALRDICWRGPNSLRNDRKTTISVAKTLVEYGWLQRIKSRRRDMMEWRIARGPSE
jgi:hypothetical protein